MQHGLAMHEVTNILDRHLQCLCLQASATAAFLTVDYCHGPQQLCLLHTL
jgi:hypothetical protein